MKNYIIAIDGPAASGKSTVAKIIAKRLNFNYLDTGAMYRALTLFVLENNIDPNDEKTIDNIVENVKVDINGSTTLLNGKNVSNEIRSNPVTAHVSKVCAYASVRSHMVDEQRRIANSSDTGVILDGRDIGTNVFPNATLKIFLTASYDVRANRRYLDNKERNIESNLEELKADLIRRDKADSSRPIAPLKQAEDAFLLDNSNMSIDETADFIINKFNERIK